MAFVVQALTVALSALLVKNIGRGVSVFQTVGIRSIVSVAAVMYLMYTQGQFSKAFGSRERRVFLMLRGA